MACADLSNALESIQPWSMLLIGLDVEVDAASLAEAWDELVQSLHGVPVEVHPITMTIEAVEQS